LSRYTCIACLVFDVEISRDGIVNRFYEITDHYTQVTNPHNISLTKQTTLTVTLRLDLAVRVKVKFSRYRPEQALGDPEG
jgi:hypothetical protein